EKAAEADEKAKDEEPKKKKKDKAKSKPEPVTIDFENIDQRIVSLPVPAGNYARLQAGAAGQIYYLEKPETAPRAPRAPGGNILHRFDLAKRKTETVRPGVIDYYVTADTRKALIAAPKGAGDDADMFTGPSLSWSIIELGAAAPAGA